MSPNDWNESEGNKKGGADGWVDEEQQQPPRQTAQEPRNAGPQIDDVRQDSQREMVHSGQNRPSKLESGDNGKMLAILSHLSILFGIPLFLIPLIQRESPLALHHAKAAAVTYGMLMIAGIITMVTCGIGFPLILLCYVPAIIGVVNASNEQPAGKWGMGDFGEQLLSGVQIENDNQ